MAIERKFVKESVNRLLVRDFVKKETSRAGFGGLDIQRTPLGTRINIIAERPGMVIGRRGSTINELTANLNAKFDLDNPQLGVDEPEDNAALNAQIMAFKVAESLERGWHFRRVGHSTVQRIMGAGAQGVIIEIAGKLTGQRKRREKFIAGNVKYCGETALELMDVGKAQCKKKLGTIGCTVRIMRKGAVLPDRVQVLAPGQKAKMEAAAAAKEAAAAAGVETVKDAPAKEEAKEAPAEPEKVDLNKLKVADLRNLAKENNVDLSGVTLKAEIIAKLEEANVQPKTDAPAEGRRERKSFST